MLLIIYFFSYNSPYFYFFNDNYYHLHYITFVNLKQYVFLPLFADSVKEMLLCQ
ncbi:hypothetical protein HMPREF1871_01037 [Gemelliphila asaccharolytica]|uniref:Uncharacterized protein n=1 Tax=Gemelliphila asaccharolytica TaxID=502393 RepID=A0ABR5TKV7_9BACL|nr:hypothetical protein HMPREF1871_01037 [Gemella asaccharolytica]